MAVGRSFPTIRAGISNLFQGFPDIAPWLNDADTDIRRTDDNTLQLRTGGTTRLQIGGNPPDNDNPALQLPGTVGWINDKDTQIRNDQPNEISFRTNDTDTFRIEQGTTIRTPATIFIGVSGSSDKIERTAQHIAVRKAGAEGLQVGADFMQAHGGRFSWQEPGDDTRLDVVRFVDVDHTISGGAPTEVVSGAIPAGAQVLSIATRVRTTVAGSGGFTTWSLGDGIDPDLYGTGLAVATGSTSDHDDHTASPLQGQLFPAGAAGDLVLTSDSGDNFTGGRVRIGIFYTEIGQPPQS